MKPVRLVIVALILIVGSLAVRHSVGLTLADRQPRLALRIDHENAIVQAEAAMKLAGGATDPGDRADARSLARQALARDAGNVTALAALGLASDEADEVAAAFTAAERLSRRDLATQLWLIETAVARGAAVRALHHYDVALRTIRSAPSILFPVLVEATADGELRPEIAKILSRRPAWGGLYLQQLAQSGDRGGAADLFVRLKQRGLATGAPADAALYARLIEVRSFDDAWRVYAAGHKGAVRAGVRNPRFAEQPLSPAPFDWQVSDNEFVNGRIEYVGRNQGSLVFSTAAGEGGEAARQLLVLPTGDYRIEAASGAITGGDVEPPYIKIDCFPSGQQLLRQSLVAERTISGRFGVPGGCTAQMLTLTVQPATGLGTVNGDIRQIRVVQAE